ncbi:hypothetical protein PENTCL1PPCAC_4607, partial [Pristionchus entomophagus]
RSEDRNFVDPSRQVRIMRGAGERGQGSISPLASGRSEPMSTMHGKSPTTKQSKTSLRAASETKSLLKIPAEVQMPPAPALPWIELASTVVGLAVCLAITIYWIIVVADPDHFRWLKTY